MQFNCNLNKNFNKEKINEFSKLYKLDKLIIKLLFSRGYDKRFCNDNERRVSHSSFNAPENAFCCLLGFVYPKIMASVYFPVCKAPAGSVKSHTPQDRGQPLSCDCFCPVRKSLRVP